MPAGSIPQDAETTTFGLASSIRLASSGAVETAKTTEVDGSDSCAGEHRDHGLGTIGM
jgi:hypothetical protein